MSAVMYVKVMFGHIQTIAQSGEILKFGRRTDGTLTEDNIAVFPASDGPTNSSVFPFALDRLRESDASTRRMSDTEQHQIVRRRRTCNKEHSEP